MLLTNHTHILSCIQVCLVQQSYIVYHVAFSPLTLLFSTWTPRRWDFTK